MEALKNLLDNLKEKLKQSWAEQQDSAWFIDLKERYDTAPPVIQKTLPWALAALAMTFVLWWPISNLMDASDLNSRFDERRQILKDLLHLERDLANQPAIPNTMSPSSFKPVMDGKIATAGIKPEQLKMPGMEMPSKMVQGAEQHGIEYRFEKLTIRQAIDLAYELEHSDNSLKLNTLEFLADTQDPHFYNVDFKIVNFAPKLASNFEAAEGGSGGKGIADAIKNRPSGGDSGNMKAPPPPPTAPALPPPPTSSAPLGMPKFAPPPPSKTGKSG